MEPERTSEVSSIDFDLSRCVELHNAIVHEITHQRSIPTANYFEHWGQQDPEAADALYGILGEALVAFLEKCDVVAVEEVQSMMSFVEGLNRPDVFPSPIAALCEHVSFFVLYPSEHLEDDVIGVVFDIETNKATWVDSTGVDDWEQQYWLPLEDILSRWLEEI